MSILLELSLRNTEWLKMATKITSSKERARDLVQDMYLAIALSEPIFRTDYSNFIYTVMVNINRNQYKKNNTFIEGKEVVKITFVDLADYER
tara:strand:- start:401 stop:676 length:276 start_codon:yes stop_codon:yes gene_type:complete